MTTPSTLEDAIFRSAFHNKVVSLPYSETLYRALMAKCEEEVDMELHDGWGEDDRGAEIVVDTWGVTYEGENWNLLLVRN